MKQKWNIFLPCYYIFMINGMMVLEVGTIMPYLISEAGLSYSLAGGLLAAFAIGNLLASFINPILIGRMGRKATVIGMTTIIPVCLYIITLIPNVFILYASFLLLGMGRGSVSIFNNTIINENSNGSNAALNLLHMTFAIGAFIAPFLASLYISIGLTWRDLVYTTIALFGISIFLLFKLPVENKGRHGDGIEKKGNYAYLRSIDFYVTGFILFFYMGSENSINGWFITYFKNTGIMSDSYATNLLSITWSAVMIGRLLTAYISKKVNKKTLIMVNCICTMLFFFLLISTNDIRLISVSIAMLGFFFAGIYPTCIASIGPLVKGSTSGMAMLLAIAALGGIVAPQIIGIIADNVGLTGAIGFLSISKIFMVLLSVVNFYRR